MLRSAAVENELARPGPKRKSGYRKASGDLILDKQPDDRVRSGRQPHRRPLKEADRMSEKAESPLGRLCLRGIVTEEMYEAGNRYAVTVGAYRSVIGAPAGLSGGGSGGEECSALCNAAHKLLTAQQRAQVHDGLFSSDVCRCLRKKEQYDSAYEALSAVGQRPAKAVARLAVHREEIAREDLVYLVIGLNALARHFGLTQGRPGA